VAPSPKDVLNASWPPAYPVFQFPNAPLLVAIGATGVARATDGDVHDYADAVASVGFAAWAYLELTDGVNAFRRLLGAAGLAYVVTRLT
jgi:hypothetical protein